MKINDKITVNNVEYKVMDKLGSGGQGSVWQVRNEKDKKVYALKIIAEKNPYKRTNKIANIKRLVNDRAWEKLEFAVAGRKISGISYACPYAWYADNATGDIGYIMKLGDGKTLSSLLLNGSIAAMDYKRKLFMLKRIAESIDILHSKGYCYTDINWGNFMWNDKAESLCVIDCENMASKDEIENGQCLFLIGTGFFIAPEVAFGKSKVGYGSDQYALASLIFRILTDNVLQSAYHGAAMYSAQPACQTMLDVAEADNEGDIDPNWRKFVFDPNDRSNGIENLCKDSKNPENIVFRQNLERTMDIWNNTIDGSLKNMFYAAFSDPFDVKKNRPIPSMWSGAIEKILTGKAQPCVNADIAPPVKRSVPVKNSKGLKKYPAFVPSGKRAAANPTANVQCPDAPYLISSSGISVPIVGEKFTISGVRLGLKQDKIGEVEKADGGYMFTSGLPTVVEISDADGKVVERLRKGQQFAVKSGESIRPVISAVSVKIVY